MEKNIIVSPPWIVVVHALIQFDTLERLCALGQNALSQELEELHEAMDADYESFSSPHDEGDYLAHINDEYIEVSETLPCLHWYAQFLIAYSFFERAMDAVCISMQKQNGSSLSLKDMSGLGITRAKTYLSKVCHLVTPFQSPYWQSALLYAEIRNVIAHRNGYLDVLPNDKKSLFYRLTELDFKLKSDIQDQQDAQIILTREIVIESIGVYKTIIKDIGGLDQDFVTPKHGLPSYRNKEKKN